MTEREPDADAEDESGDDRESNEKARHDRVRVLSGLGLGPGDYRVAEELS